MKPVSPCIDAGNPDTSALPTVDKDGNPRVVGDRVDMGAYEYCPNCPPTIALGVVDADAAEEGLHPGIFGVYCVNGDLTKRVVVPYRTSGGAGMGTDYEPLTGNAVIPEGAYRGIIRITPIDDAIQEGNERVGVTLQEQSGYIRSQPKGARLFIQDND